MLAYFSNAFATTCSVHLARAAMVTDAANPRKSRHAARIRLQAAKENRAQ